ncbi:MAG: TIGR03905 family TSCPD domain-containing protein [Clostridia bacterium]|nr:TIGR03905 family TSCPD domain-containing protein [Clostridia bacterium]
MQFTYKTNGVCSRKIVIDVENGVVENVRFEGGCNGNTQGVAALVKGMKVKDVINRLENIKCGFKNTSCPDQLAQALKKMDAENLE